MRFFPQLITGTVAQYPLRVSVLQRAVVNVAGGGERFTSFDPAAGERAWDLQFHALAWEEANRLRALFAECEGRLGSFTFADPAGNLLARSGEFDLAPWQSAPLLAWTGGLADPFGGNAAMRVENSSGAPQAVQQAVALPAGYELCFSLWARSLAGAEVVVRRTSAGETMAAAFSLGGEWRRIETAAALSGEGESVEFAVEIPGAAAVEFFGAQVEAQRHASGYKPTHARSGVFGEARFGQDNLAIESDGYLTFGARVRVVAPL